MRTIEANPPEADSPEANSAPLIPMPDVIRQHIDSLENELAVSKKLLKLSVQLHTVRLPMFGREAAMVGGREVR
jgi:hypothetical protein